MGPDSKTMRFIRILAKTLSGVTEGQSVSPPADHDPWPLPPAASMPDCRACDSELLGSQLFTGHFSDFIKPKNRRLSPFLLFGIFSV